jgi:hypothetical protein
VSSQQESPVPLSRDQKSGARRIEWLAILRTLLIQVLVLVALSAAFVRYVDWSSEAAFSQFLATSRSSEPAARPRPAMPVNAITGSTPCGWRI